MNHQISLRALTGLLVAAIVSSLAGPPAQAQEAPLKVAVIDVQRILTDSVAGKKALDDLRKLAESRQAEIDAKGQEVTDLQNRLNEGQLSLSPERQEQMQAELQEMLIGLRRLQDDAERELQTRRGQAFEAIEVDVLPIITEVGQEFQYTMIFNKFQSGLLFALERIDITDLILLIDYWD